MTPAARVAAAIEVLDTYLSGSPAEKALTNWARRSRFAGSGDRAAVRDHVFDALRNLRSYAALGGADTGRGLMIGQIRATGRDAGAIFTGEGHAPAPLTDTEAAPPAAAMPDAVALDCPDALLPLFRDSLGSDMAAVLRALKSRAPVFLRVNTARTDVATVQDMLAGEGITTRPHPLSNSALEVLENPRKVANSQAFRGGLVELQDAASQFVADQVPLPDQGRVLDYCAGGGGKALAIAARGDAQVFAHDIDPGRMADLSARATRAGADIIQLSTDDISDHAPYDTVFCDAPCSGSGAWRRSPEAKWALTLDRLAALTAIQAEILDQAATLVAPDGTLVYATCSLFTAENGTQIAGFLDRNPGWQLLHTHALTPLDGGDGFYVAILGRVSVDS